MNGVRVNGVRVHGVRVIRVPPGFPSARRRSESGSESGSAAPLAVGLSACLVLTAVLLVPLYRGVVLTRSLAAAADSAALAGADAASGLEAGFPCERAAQSASLSGVRLEECTALDGIVTVTVSGELLGQRLRVEARGGPPVCVWCA